MDAGARAQTKKATMAVIFIALLHAAPVFLIGIHTKSRGWLIASAVVSGILAVNLGGDRLCVRGSARYRCDCHLVLDSTGDGLSEGSRDGASDSAGS